MMRGGRSRRQQSGFTLIEVVVTMAVMSVVSLSLIAAQTQMSAAVTGGRETTIAMNLAEEKLEALKALPFYRVAVTSTVALDDSFDPIVQYDPAFYPPEHIHAGSRMFERRTFVEKVDAPYGTIENMGYPHPDTGLKRITVHVSWDRKGVARKVHVSSLKANQDREPLEKTVAGTVTDASTGLPVAGVNVAARRNPGWGAVTDVTGYYSFQATDNSMRLVGNKAGYYSYDSGTSFALGDGTTVWDFEMVRIGSRTVSGYAQHRPGLVISQVCANDNGREYVELYNPSTFSITMSDKKVKYVDEHGVITQIPLTILTDSVPPGGYFFVLGSPTGTDTTSPTNGKTADAIYDNHPSGIEHAKDGGVALTDAFDAAIDSVGWGDPAPAGGYTGDYFSTFPGMGTQKALIRKAVSTSTAADMDPPSGAHVPMGNAFNSLDNSRDFLLRSVTYPRNTSDSNTPSGGTILPGAWVSADDPVSGAVQAYATGYFELTVATGTWELFVGSGTLQSVLPVTVDEAAAFVYMNAVATATSDMGYVTGEIRKFSSPTDLLSDLLVQADPGGYQTTSNSQGVYFLALPADEYFITGNPDFDNPNWNTATTEESITVTAGVVTGGVHLSIWKDGWISGRVTSGGDGVANVVVVSTGDFANGNTAMTDAAGYYTIKGLRLIGNPYRVRLSLTDGETSAPEGYSISVTQGGNRTGTDFTVSGFYRDITGTVTDGGGPIETGVLVMASTSAIDTASPPDMTFAVRSGADYYFQSFSGAQGEYSLSVPGGQSYNIVAWYHKDGATSDKTRGAVYVSPSTGTAGVDFAWP
ncbi:MAG: carboxypeptidase regulatory-like domain-containing protein [Elusimicrobiota bacterium]